MDDIGFGFGCGSEGYFGGPFASPGATYGFAGIAGSGTTSSAGTNTVTETITSGSHTSTVVFTAKSANASLYQVTSVTAGTHTQTITPSSSSPTYGFQYNAATQTTMVTETITGANSTETQTYTSGALGSSSYALTNDTITYTCPSTSHVSYSFGTSGSITETVTWGSHSFNNTEPLGPTASLSGVGTATVTETSISGNSVTTVTFTGSSSAGYAIGQTSTSFVPQGSATTALNVNPHDRADFNLTANTVTWISPNGAAGTPQSITANSHVTFTELGPATGVSGDFVGETVTFGSHSSFEIFYSSTGTSGEYMDVAHGSGSASSVGLVGIASQLAALNQLHTLVT